jgi:hypothetical protein
MPLRCLQERGRGFMGTGPAGIRLNLPYPDHDTYVTGLFPKKTFIQMHDRKCFQQLVTIDGDNLSGLGCHPTVINVVDREILPMQVMTGTETLKANRRLMDGRSNQRGSVQSLPNLINPCPPPPFQNNEERGPVLRRRRRTTTATTTRKKEGAASAIASSKHPCYSNDNDVSACLFFFY